MKNSDKELVEISLDESNAIATIHMNDEEGRNIFSENFVKSFLRALEKLEKKIHPKVAILRGLKDVFCGGGDKQTLLALTTGEITTNDLILSERMLNMPFPIIAAMEGHAIGGGLLIGACSDIVIMAEESRYGAVFMNMGFTPGMGSTTLLPALLGPYVATEFLFSGKRYKGKELINKGCNINHILPRESVLKKAKDIAGQISEKTAPTIYLLKHSLNTVKKKMLIDARLQEDLMHQLSFSFPETKEIIKEFYVE